MLTILGVVVGITIGFWYLFRTLCKNDHYKVAWAIYAMFFIISIVSSVVAYNRKPKQPEEVTPPANFQIPLADISQPGDIVDQDAEVTF